MPGSGILRYPAFLSNILVVRRSNLSLLPTVLALLLVPATISSQSAEVGPRQAEAPSPLRASRALAAQGKWKDAELLLRSYRNRHPEAVEANVLHADALTHLNQPFDAMLELQSIIREHPESVLARKRYGLLLTTVMKDAARAESIFEECTKLAPEDVEAWTLLGDVYFQQSRMQDAAHAFAEASRIRPTDPFILASLAYAQGQEAESAESDAGFRRAMELNEHSQHPNGAVDLLYGRYLLDTGHARESLAAFSRALAQHSRSPDCLYQRARAYQYLGEYEKAQEDALAVLRLAPRRKDAPMLLVQIFRSQGKLDEVEKYAAIVQRISQEEDERQLLGRQVSKELDAADPALKTGNFREAAVHFENVVKLIPTYYEAYFNLGVCYSQIGESGNAEAAIRKYVSFQPASADGHALLGILLLQQGRGREATPELEQSLQLDPALIEARKSLGQEYVKESKIDSAIRVLRSGGRDDPEELTILAVALQKSGKSSEALSAIDHALRLAPDDPEALRVRGELLHQRDIQH